MGCACRTVLNGNGKLPWELEEAARQGVLINVDSEFDLANIIAAAKSTNTAVKVLLRINPDVDPKVSASLEPLRAGTLRSVTYVILHTWCRLRSLLFSLVANMLTPYQQLRCMDACMPLHTDHNLFPHICTATAT